MEITCLAWRPDASGVWQSQWIQDYLETGIQAYIDHYCHLWPEGDPSPYLSRNFTENILRRETWDSSLLHWVVYVNRQAAGICKLDLERESGDFYPSQALFLEKIYFRSAFTGKGVGRRIMRRIEKVAHRNAKRGIWLETMQKGPALAFYQKQGFQILGPSAVPYPEVLEEEKHMWVVGKGC